MTPAAANFINLSGRTAMEFDPHHSSPCGLIIPSYMTGERREGRCLEGSDEGLGSLAAGYTIRAP
jgi:hypothetical protein